MVLHRRLPKVLAGTVGGEVEAEQGVVRLRQLLPQLDEKLLSLERDLHYFGPAERVNFETVLEDNQANARYSELYVSARRILEIKKIKNQ